MSQELRIDLVLARLAGGRTDRAPFPLVVDSRLADAAAMGSPAVHAVLYLHNLPGAAGEEERHIAAVVGNHLPDTAAEAAGRMGRVVLAGRRIATVVEDSRPRTRLDHSSLAALVGSRSHLVERRRRIAGLVGSRRRRQKSRRSSR